MNNFLTEWIKITKQLQILLWSKTLSLLLKWILKVKF